MRIVKEPEERKQEILDASIRVFARKGYDKTSISDIAKEIGISQGLCYRYFPSKEVIYEACIDKYAEYIASENIKKAKLEGMSLRQQILKVSGRLDEYSNTEKGEKNLYEFFHKEGSHRIHKELFQRVSEKLVPYITEVLDTAKKNGEIKVADTGATAYFFVFGQMGILMSKEYSEEEKANMIKQCLFELVGI